uniref:Transmembrane protein 158 (gene/pseudogene) n=1 Tax=Esox lucius TaxID=8010 RepID=A0A6Q2YPB4_ESOLU
MCAGCCLCGQRAIPSFFPQNPERVRERSMVLAAHLPQCNVSVQRLFPTSLVARWDSNLGFHCDLFIYTANNHGRAFFSAAINRAISPVVIEHLGVTGGQQEFKLCVGCGMSRYRRFGRSKAQNTGDPINFCCVDFSLDELNRDKSWRLNRKPIESTLVACFMTLVIIVWSVAALIWPVPIIAGFLPNGMEQRRKTLETTWILPRLFTVAVLLH